MIQLQIEKSATLHSLQNVGAKGKPLFVFGYDKYAGPSLFREYMLAQSERLNEELITKLTDREKDLARLQEVCMHKTMGMYRALLAHVRLCA